MIEIKDSAFMLFTMRHNDPGMSHIWSLKRIENIKTEAEWRYDDELDLWSAKVKTGIIPDDEFTFKVEKDSLNLGFLAFNWYMVRDLLHNANVSFFNPGLRFRHVYFRNGDDAIRARLCV